MGGYGTPIGETKSYRVYLYVNTSVEYNYFTFKVERKSDNMDIGYVESEYNEEVEEFNKELQESYDMFYLSKKGLRNKAEFEYKLREIEKENMELKEIIALYKEKLGNIRKIV